MKIAPYLNFSGRCEEAITLYRSAVGADVHMLVRNKDMPAQPAGTPQNDPPEGCAPGPLDPDKIMHAELRIGPSSVMATDGGGMPSTGFAGFSLSVSVADEAEARRVFEALGEGGKTVMPLDKTSWSPCFGMLTDRFGVAWMVGVDQAG